MEARRRLRRGYEVSECDKAKLRLADSIWGDTYDAKNKAGTCANSHQPTGRCKECMEEFEGNGGAYVVKNKTACGAGVKSKELRGSTHTQTLSLCGHPATAPPIRTYAHTHAHAHTHTHAGGSRAAAGRAGGAGSVPAARLAP